jgi:hypothetical protein
MQEKIISLPFNRKQFIINQKNIWKFTSGKALKPNLIYTVAAIVIFTINLNTKASSFDQILLGAMLFYTIIRWIDFIERWVRFFRLVKIYADRFEKEKMTSIYTFNDNGLKYEDHEKMFQLSWHLLKPFEAYKDNIYIKQKNQVNSVTLILSRQELGDDQYHEVYTILEEKTG